MKRKPKFKPVITRVKLNPEQAVLTCSCYNTGQQSVSQADNDFGPVGFLPPWCMIFLGQKQTSAGQFTNVGCAFSDPPGFTSAGFYATGGAVNS